MWDSQNGVNFYMSSWISHSADVIKAASVNIFGLSALMLLLVVTLTYWFLRKTRWKIRAVAVAGFIILCVVILVIVVRNTPTSNGQLRTATSQAVNQTGQTNVNTSDVTQSGSVNTNGVGGSVNVQVVHQPEIKKRHTR